MADDESPTADMVTYEELADLECEFDDLDVEIIRKQYHLSKPLYERRSAAVAKIPGFWALVFEEAPPEIARFIQPSDSEIFANHLEAVTVDRFELSSRSSDSTSGDPRSISITFTFSENPWFSDRTLTKKFWWRRASDGWTGLVSEPVPIQWHKGKDPTKGLVSGALKLWAARTKAGDMRRRELPEWDAMAKLTETWNGDNTSFFTWFAFVSGRRWVGEDESAAAVRAEKSRREGGGGEAAVLPPDEDQLEGQVEAHEEGEQLATLIAEDLWPGAIKYFTQAQESAEMSDDEFEDSDEDDEDEDEDDGEQVDLRALAEGRTKRSVDGEAGARKRQKV